MTLSQIEVEHIAMLARLALSDDEKKLFAAQLSAVLEYAARLQSLDTTGIPPVFNVLAGEGQESSAGSRLAGAANLRDDQPQTGLDEAALFGNAPHIQDRQFRIPPVFE